MILQWREFLVDVPSFLDWCSTHFSCEVVGTSGVYLSVFRKRVGSDPGAPFTDEEQATILDKWKSLTEGPEATKRALPSRKILRARSDFEISVKNFIATKDWAAMSVVERKFFMGGSLTSAEYDTLVAS